MKISELPKGLRQLAELRRAEYLGELLGDVRFIRAAFKWSRTPEGPEFWQAISAGRFERYYGCRVVNVKFKER